MRTINALMTLCAFCMTSLLLIKQGNAINTGMIQDSLVSGVVLDSLGNPVADATIGILGSPYLTKSSPDGTFAVRAALTLNDTLLINATGFSPRRVSYRGEQFLRIILLPVQRVLDEVTIVSTGYNRLPKERATGSFHQIDNQALNRQVSTDLISRLEDITPSLALDRRMGGEPKFSIRGRSTLFADEQPLIVVDNFPYDGDITSINPNDIESVTVLKDAAAASIWGVRAGNGVIVITTKQGTKGETLNIEFNANANWLQKPDVFYNPAFLNASDFIDVEQTLYEQGYYQSWINHFNKVPLSPVVSILANAEREGWTESQIAEQIDQFRHIDVRNDIDSYLLRNGLEQQYALSIRGGGNKSSYAVSSGYNNNLSSTVGNMDERFNINALLDFNPIERLRIGTNLVYTQRNSTANGFRYGGLGVGTRELYPYAQLADGEGNALALAQDYSNEYKREMMDMGVLDWAYRPLEEVGLRSNSTTNHEIRINSGIKYKLLDGLDVELRYQYFHDIGRVVSVADERSYEARNLVNRFTEASEGNVIRYIPEGAIKNTTLTEQRSHTGRFQVNYNRNWGGDHQLNTLLGIEAKEGTLLTSAPSTLYGLDPEVLTFAPIDFNQRHPTLPRGISTNIPNAAVERETLDRYRSFFANAAYTLKGKYSLSASARIDQSNYFGVRTNQKSVPLWSLGASWDLHREAFMDNNWLTYLKLRATYGFSGNLDRSLTAFTTAAYSTDSYNGARRATIRNAGNPDLRWERIAMANVGLDFRIQNGVIGGSIEYYQKRGRDMIGFRALEPTTGVYNMATANYGYKGNFAATKGEGIDLDLHTQPFGHGSVKWEGRLLLSYTQDEVTAYDMNSNAFAYLTYGAGLVSDATFISPNEGYPIFGIYAYKWGGLDPENGDPMGYYNGEPSKHYNDIANRTSPDQLVFFGRALPSTFGTVGNTLTVGDFAVSFHITYKLGYYFRRSGVSYSGLYSNWYGHEEFGQRWQNPGDEQRTQVPSLAPPSFNMLAARDNFYLRSETLVERGDNVRLQDVQLTYTLPQSVLRKMGINRLQLYAYFNNLGIIWRANKHGLDPDNASSFSYPRARTAAIGIRTNF